MIKNKKMFGMKFDYNAKRNNTYETVTKQVETCCVSFEEVGILSRSFFAPLFLPFCDLLHLSMEEILSDIFCNMKGHEAGTKKDSSRET